MTIRSLRHAIPSITIVSTSLFFLCLPTTLSAQPGAAAKPAKGPAKPVGQATDAEWFRNWTMESRVGRSQLILVARVKNISAVHVVRGAKVDTSLREYRFQPVRILKGVFTRDEITMTHADLGLPAIDSTQRPPFQEGDFLLLMLARQASVLPVYSCVGIPNQWLPPAQQVPKLAGPNDAIVSMTAALVQVSETPSRRERAELLLRQLDRTSGPAVVPLLASLGQRGYWAGQLSPDKSLARLGEDQSPAIRAAAVQAIQRVITEGGLKNDNALGTLARVLRRLLESDDMETQARVAALNALGHLGQFGRKTDWTSALLVKHLEEGRTHAEREAAADALARLKAEEQQDRLLAVIDRLPLDEIDKRQRRYIAAATRLAGQDAGPTLMRRLQRKVLANHPAYVEIDEIGRLEYSAAVPALIRAAVDGRQNDENQLAIAFRRLRDQRAVPVLARWLHRPNRYLRWEAHRALDAIDTDEAMAAIRLALKAEPDLRLKLRMAESLGRHGITDGYAFAIEHLADPGITSFAAKALGTIRDKRTNEQLWRILTTSNDRKWNGAALRGLAAMRDPKLKERLLKIISNPRHVLLVDAIVASQELGDDELVRPLASLVASRNFNVATASLAALKQLAEQRKADDENAEAFREAGSAMLSLLDDPDVNVKLRIAALEALRTLNDARLGKTLEKLVDQSDLENTGLLTEIQRALAST